jgi:4-hydroxybenzoate polyprenyltransferase
MTFSDSDKVDIIEVEVPEEGFIDDIHKMGDENLTRRERRRLFRHQPKPQSEGKNKFGWAFFLASLFIGIGLTATFETPLGIFLGLGLGFLFFVDPIYHKVMSWLDSF